jgi:hypothetical protein
MSQRNFAQLIVDRVVGGELLDITGCVLPALSLQLRRERDERRTMRIGGQRVYCQGHFIAGYADFPEDVRFDQSWFAGGATFSNCAFLSECSFQKTVFEQQVSFKGSTLSRTAYFFGAKFAAMLFMSRVQCGGVAAFHEVEFGAQAVFDHSTFSGGIAFGRSKFEGMLQFSDVRTMERCEFDHCSFDAEARFERTNFAGRVNFTNAHWRADVKFGAASLSDAKPLSFLGCTMEALAFFNDVVWPADADAYVGAFADARFRRIAIFDGEFCAFSMFSGTTFDADVSLGSSTFLDDDAFARAVSSARRGATNAAKARNMSEQYLTDIYLQALENGFRVLKQVHERLRDRELEQIYYRLELLARREQSRRSNAELLVSYAYGLTSDYGRSFVRPLMALGIVWLFFAVVFWEWETVCQVVFGFSPGIRAADLSSQNTFAPLSVWVARSDTGVLALANQALSPASLLALKLVCSIQSVVVIALVFLEALALRRRFQIN